MKKYFFPAIKLFIILTIITGVLYPLSITLFANIFYPDKSKGSMITNKGKLIGSELIGQKFSSDKYFWARPSAVDYNPMPSGGSNYGPTSKALLDSVNARKDLIVKHNFVTTPSLQNIPKDLLFASASGVDPDISPEAAYFQIDRIAKARNYNESQKKGLNKLVDDNILNPQFGLFGIPRVNVILLNIKLDELK